MDPVTMAMIASMILPAVMGGGGTQQTAAPVPAGGMNPAAMSGPMAATLNPAGGSLLQPPLKPIDYAQMMSAPQVAPSDAANQAAAVAAGTGTQPSTPKENSKTASTANDWLAASAQALAAIAPFLTNQNKQSAAPIPGGSVGNMVPSFSVAPPSSFGSFLSNLPRVQ